MSSEKKCPETPPKPKDGESQKLVEHLRSAHKSKEAMIETHFENEILQAYFNDELLGMDMDLVILTYMDPSMLILGPMIDFGTPHPEDTRTEKTRKMERQNHKIKALERYLMLASGIEIDSSMILTHPDLFVKWTLYNIESGKNIPSTKPSMKFRQKAGELAKMMIEKEAWKRQLVILENLSCETEERLKWVWHFRDIYTILQQNSSSKIPKIEVEKYEDDSIRKDAMKEVGDLEQILFLEQEKAKILENTTVEKPKKGSIATWYWHWKRNVLNQVQDRWESQTDSKQDSKDLNPISLTSTPKNFKF